MTNVAEMRTIKPSGAYSDIKLGGMKDRKTGLTKSVGISYTPMNGDTGVTYNIMNDPTKPTEVSNIHFTATPEALEQIKSGSGELGKMSLGQQFNKGIRRMAGLGGMDPSRIDQGDRIFNYSSPNLTFATFKVLKKKIMTKFLLPIAINVINKAVDKIPEDLDDLLKKFVVSLLKKAAAKTGNKVDDLLVAQLEKALFESKYGCCY